MKLNPGYILVFCFSVLLVQGCIYQYFPECEGHSFCLHYTTDAEDPAYAIEGNVHLHIYTGGLLDTVLVVPAEELAKEKRYPLPNHYSGEITLVAWAVAKGGSEIYGIPEGIPGKSIKEKRVRLQPVSGSIEEEFRPIGFLHSGQTSFDTGNQTESQIIPVPLKPSVSRLNIQIRNNAPVTKATPPEEVNIQVYGTCGEMDFDLKPCGKAVTVPVRCPFNEKENRWETGEVCLLPSAEDQTVSIRIMPAGGSPYVIHTYQPARPGDVIRLIIDNKETNEVELFINGWKIVHFKIEDL